MKKFVAIVALGWAFSCVAVAAPAKKAPVVDLKFCPMTLESAKADKSSQIVGQTRVNFCCPGCDVAFKKLSPQAKSVKIAAVLKKQNAKKS